MGHCAKSIIRQLAVGLALTCVTSGLAIALPASLAPASLAPALLAPASPATDESFGPHSLKTQAGAQAGTQSDVCYFCHTPQGRQPGGPGWDGPGWESGQPVAEFASYDALGSGGNIGMRGNVSVACLSCHDGSQAPDAVANMPYVSASLGSQNLQRSMTVGHPVGIVFSGYQPQATSGLIPGNRLQRDMIGGEVRWWLDMETVPDGVRDKTDVILYTQGAGAGAQPFVECASCHDPHATPGNMFLRAPTAGSDLCQACHNY